MAGALRVYGRRRARRKWRHGWHHDERIGKGDDGELAQRFRRRSGLARRKQACRAFCRRMPLARYPGVHLGSAYNVRRRPDRKAPGFRLEPDNAPRSAACLRSYPAPRGYARRYAGNRGNLHIPNGSRAVQRRCPPRLQWQQAPGLDADDVARRNPRSRGSGQWAALAECRLEAQFRRRELGRPAQVSRRLCRPRSDGIGGRRCAGRPDDGGPPLDAGRRYACDRPRAAAGRFLAPPLPRAHLAQRDAGESLSLHAFSAFLAGLHSEGHAGQLVRDLRRGTGTQRLDRNGTRGRNL